MEAEMQLVKKVLSKIETNFKETFGYEQSLSLYDYMLTRYNNTEYNALLGDINYDLHHFVYKTPAPLHFVLQGGIKGTVSLSEFLFFSNNLFTDEYIILSKFETPIDFVEVHNFVNIVHANVKYRAVLTHITELGSKYTKPNLERDLADISQDKLGLFYKLQEIDQSLKKMLPPQTEAKIAEDLDDLLRSIPTVDSDDLLRSLGQPKSEPTVDSDDDLEQFLDSFSDTTSPTYKTEASSPPDSTRYYYYENTGEGEGNCFVITTPVLEIYPNMFASELDCHFAKDLMPKKLVNIIDCTRFKKFETDQSFNIEVDDLEKLNTNFKTYEFDYVETPKGVEGMHVSAILSLIKIFNPAIQNDFKAKALTLKIGSNENAMRTYLTNLSTILQAQLYIWNFEMVFEILLLTKFPDSELSSTKLVNMPLCLFQLEGNKSNIEAVIPLVPVTLFKPFL